MRGKEDAEMTNASVESKRMSSGRSSTARKNSVQEHYKQFYGGGEDDVITSIA